MKRLHIHLAVDNLAASIHFYSALFAAEPAVQKPDYAKWMLDDPRVNFAISQRGAQAGLNHLGIQVESAAELDELQARLAVLQPDAEIETGVACCYAQSDKYWTTDPQGIAWEAFHTLAAIPVFGECQADQPQQTDHAACCIPLAQPARPAQAPCCVPAAATPGSAACCQ